MNRTRGFVMMLVFIIGSILLLLGITLYNFIGQQNVNVHLIANAEVAHFLAEAGINASIRSVRETLQAAGFLNGARNPLFDTLTQQKPLADLSLMSQLKDTWNKDLEDFSKEVDKTAGIRVEVWLRDFRQTETDPNVWVDPGAKTGWLSVESTGEYKGTRRTLCVRRKVWVGNVLPPLVSKFTLHLKDPTKGQEGRFNLIRNDYNSNITDGPRPFICLNHATPESPIEARSVGQILSDESDPNVYLRRGWVWLGGGRIRLQITSGAGSLGEIFHFYDVSNPNTFQAVRFKSPPGAMPAAFGSPQTFPWDLVATPREASYQIGHSFVIEGFHDKSNRMEHDAMYEGEILSESEKSLFGSHSNTLHLFGEARKGFQSRTRVFGKVMAAFPRFATLEITPQESDVKQKFDATKPPPLYLLPSMSESNFDPGREIADFKQRHFGGPILAAGFLCPTFPEYKKMMSGIIEVPYITAYNAMQDIVSGKTPRQFPPISSVLAEDPGNSVELHRGGLTIYRGRVDNTPRLLDVVDNRVQQEVSTLAEFWKTFWDEKTQSLQLNTIVRIANEEKLDLFLPPAGKPQPLKVTGGGMIVLAKGNLILRGVQVQSPTEALTVVLVSGQNVFFETAATNHLNILAPSAEITCGARVEVFGTVAAGGIQADGRTPGGFFRYREAQDPTRPEHQLFYKIRADEKDSFWHE